MKNKMVLNSCTMLVVGFLSFALASCDLLLAILGGEEGGGTEFSSEQMATALKQALTTGSYEAGDELSKVGGFNNVPARRIPLPPEADTAINSLNTLPSVGTFSAKTVFDSITGTKLNNLLNSINASAEDASKGVAAAFAASITSMTFQDALIILKGEKGTEATEYLETTTKAPLKAAFKEVIDPALNAELFYDLLTNKHISANKLWNDVITEYNDFARLYNPAVDTYNLFASSKLSKINLINTDLGDFVLEKALTAVFKEMAEVEKRIREDPYGFITDLFSDISAKVFDWAKKLAL